MHKGKLSWLCPHRTGESYRNNGWLRMLKAWPRLQQRWCGWCQERMGSWGFSSPLPVPNPAKPRDLLTIPPALLLPVRLMNAKQTAEKCNPHVDIPKPAVWQMLPVNDIFYSQMRFLAISWKTLSILQIQTRCSHSDAFWEGCPLSSLDIKTRDSLALS